MGELHHQIIFTAGSRITYVSCMVLWYMYCEIGEFAPSKRIDMNEKFALLSDSDNN